MAGLCSAHKKADPSCRLCQAHPRDILPDWDSRVKAAQDAGTVKCAGCGFEFFLTVNMCPKCSMLAEPSVLMRVSEMNLSLATEVMWFVNEWCKETGWKAPRIKNDDSGFVIYAFPPNCDGKPDDSARETPARSDI